MSASAEPLRTLHSDPPQRRALAKALTNYGYSYEACIEELVISNDDLTYAAAALVKRFGEPNTSPVLPSRKLSVSSLYLYSSFSMLLFLTILLFFLSLFNPFRYRNQLQLKRYVQSQHL